MKNINIDRNYSTSETFTGKYWIDGKKIYRKVVIGNTGTLTYPGTESLILDNSLNNKTTWLIGFNAIMSYNIPINYYYAANGSVLQGFWIDFTSNGLRLIYSLANSTYAASFSNRDIRVILEYIKPSEE